MAAWLIPASSSVYVGPGDIVSGATAWYGLRAYSNATKGGNCVDIIRASDSSTQTFNTLSTGALDVASITTFLAATTGKVSKIYDQTGNGNHLTQGTDASRPAFTLNAIGALPGITWASTNSLTLAHASFNGGTNLNQPWTHSVVFKDTGTATWGALLSDASGSAGSYCKSSAQAEIYAGSDNPVSGVTVNTWHAMQGVANGASSDTNIDGVVGSMSAGTRTYPFSTNDIALGVDAAGDYFVGLMVEVGVWPVGFSSGNSTSMSSNQHAYWGF